MSTTAGPKEKNCTNMDPNGVSIFVVGVTPKILMLVETNTSIFSEASSCLGTAPEIND